MSEANRCPRCGTALSPGEAQGLCPACLLQAGMESQSAAGAPLPVSGRSAAETPTESLAPAPRVGEPTPKIPADLSEPGQQFGKYRLLRRLGRGGMGAVFEADDLESGRRVALKLLAHSLESPEARNRFFREGRLAASINHPNSVYVYGTEEIDGTPAISMEHVVGGTLQQRVRQRGPLPVTEAVDAILQIIDGLEAAAAVGVLHRDVKPSNCFVDADGTVKVGDFGLSISTTVRSDSHLTSPGSVLGTPAFSSPEQLRGDDLDVRSDIYAVGVTLFYLLTGRTPYEADHLVKLLATVLEQPAPSPTVFRKEIPRGLARVIVRCLAKQPSDRFRNYAELREALVPYNSTAPTPATLAWRFLGGLCDQLLWMIPVMAVMLVVFGGDISAMADAKLLRSPGYIAAMISAIVLQGLYFAIPEGLWGASLGKAICRLRVVDRGRNRIGVPRALARTAIYIAFPCLIVWAYMIATGGATFDMERVYRGEGSAWAPMLISYTYYGMLALLFSTARRRNGYAGLHDLAVGSQVILRAAYRPRPRLEVAEERLPDLDPAKTIGPYHVLDTLGVNKAGEFLLGYDMRLLRRVWIHKLPAGSPPVSIERRNMGRIGRLRWINGRRDGECWDVYEALSGQPLLKLIERPQPWSAVRHWLLDLARELNAATQDGSMPPALALDRVWVTAAGRVKLLDFPAPGTSPTRETIDGPAWLQHVARAALHETPAGRGSDPTVSAGSVSDPTVSGEMKPLPVEARELLERLPAAEGLNAVCEDLKRLVRKTPAVTRARRVAMLCVTAVLPLLFTAFGMLGVYLVGRLHQQHPEMAELQSILLYMDWSAKHPSAFRVAARPAPDVERAAMETYIAGKFRSVIGDRKIWDSFAGLAIEPRQRRLAERIVAERPAPSAAELAEATARLEPTLKEVAKLNTAMQPPSPLVVGAAQFWGMWLIFVALAGLILVVAMRRGLVMLMFGVDCVTRRGKPASRLRMVWRTLVFNAPVLLAPAVLGLVYALTKSFAPSLLAVAAMLLAVTVWSLMLRTRGLADRLAGTYPVPH